MFFDLVVMETDSRCVYPSENGARTTEKNNFISVNSLQKCKIIFRNVLNSECIVSMGNDNEELPCYVCYVGFIFKISANSLFKNFYATLNLVLSIALCNKRFYTTRGNTWVIGCRTCVL